MGNNFTENPMTAIPPVEHLTARQIQAVLDAFAQSGELRRGPFRLYKGVFANPLDMFRVPPGVMVVAVYDGDYERPELLDKGPYHPRAFPMAQQVDLYAVNVRECMYSIPATQEFTLPYRSTVDASVTPIGARLGLTIDYQVELPELVALKLQHPVTALHQAAIDEACYTIVPLRIEELLNTVRVKTAITHRLESASFVQETGIRILRAHVTSLWIDPEIVRALRAKFLAEKRGEERAVEQSILFEEDLRQKEKLIERLGIVGYSLVDPVFFTSMAALWGKTIENNPTSIEGMADAFKKFFPTQTAPTGGELPYPLLNTANMPTQLTVLDQLNQERQILSVQGVAATVTRSNDNYQVVMAFRTSKGQSLTILAECSDNYPLETPTFSLMVNQKPTPPPVAWEPNGTFLTFVQALRMAFT